MIPKKLFLTKGVGYHKERLASFEEALRKAGIAHLNLVRVSSILPPRCKIVSRKKGLAFLKPGTITYCVLADNRIFESSRLISSSIGVAVPKNPDTYGYLSEHEGFGQSQKVAGDYAEDLAATMLATTLGVEFNLEDAWDKKREVYKFSGKIVRTQNITQAAIGKRDLWVSTVAAAVFCEFSGAEVKKFS